MQLQNHKLITSPSELADVCLKLINEPVIAVDTEFFWERTYYPILGLVQIATVSKECFLIDTVMLSDIKALGPVLENKSVVKILHDAPQDLGILARETEAEPCNIFDTRTSAGFAGFDSTGSLQNLLKQTLNVDLAKSETRSNWIKRPLTEAQLSYAAEDVIYLPDLREDIIRSCADSDVRKWMEEENALLDVQEIYGERDPREMFRRVKGSSRLNAGQLAVLRELAEWRENKARRRNLPRNRILSNTALINLALRAPTDIAAAKGVPDFPLKMPVGVINELLDAIRRGLACPVTECPQPEYYNSATRNKLKIQTTELLAYIQKESDRRKIDPALVASRGDAEAYILNMDNKNTPTGKLGNGWRREFVNGFESRPENI